MNDGLSRNYTIYRVNFPDGKENVEIVCFGMECLDTSVTGHYMSIRDTPRWVQERIAVLSMLDIPSRSVDGIGQRIERHTYWLYAD